MLALQKYLGWLQRYLYNVDFGALPPIRASIDISQDWPLELTRINTSLTTIVGTASATVYAPGNEKHGLVWTLVSSKTNLATPWPAADAIGLILMHPEGTAVSVIAYEQSLALDAVPLIRGGTVPVGTNIQVRGTDPVYVPPGGSLLYVHTSATAANTAGIIGSVVERPKYYPLRLP